MTRTAFLGINRTCRYLDVSKIYTEAPLRVDALGDILLGSDLTPGSSFDASAHPFAEFSLCKDGQEVLRLRYVPDAEVERHGGIAYQSDHSGQRWTLQFFRTPSLQRESYRVVREGTVIVTSEVLKPLRTSAITYSDGKIWHCHTKLLGTEVENTEGVRVLHTSPKLGMTMGQSSLHVDHAMEESRGIPLLLILTHLTTHNDR